LAVDARPSRDELWSRFGTRPDDGHATVDDEPRLEIMPREAISITL